MKVFNSEQKRFIDQFTILNESVSSIDLMERAANEILLKTLEIVPDYSLKEFIVFCGQGNNGGDGLAFTRLLIEKKDFYNVKAVLCRFSEYLSADCEINLTRLKEKYPDNIVEIQEPINFDFSSNTVVIDALFGTGLNRELSGKYEELVKIINNTNLPVISVDIPSGFFSEIVSTENTVAIRADHTICIDSPVLSALLPENFDYFGNIHIVDIGLSSQAKYETPSKYKIITENFVLQNLKKRKRFDHKGSYGHTLIVAGSFGKAGAAVLSAKAAIKSGVGLVSLHIPQKILEIIQISVPEAMCSTDNYENVISHVKFSNAFSSLGIGPGIGTKDITVSAIKNLFKGIKVPAVIDADGLNCLAKIENFHSLLPEGTILTPHPKEFERLFGKFNNTLEILDFISEFSRKNKIIIVYKTGHTFISDFDENIYINIKGNPGMATGGSGDVLTGIIASLLAQKYNPVVAAIVSVFVHACSGDLCKNKFSMISTTASDIINTLPEVFLSLEKKLYK